jgi:hypothetical protein
MHDVLIDEPGLSQIIPGDVDKTTKRHNMFRGTVRKTDNNNLRIGSIGKYRQQIIIYNGTFAKSFCSDPIRVIVPGHRNAGTVMVRKVTRAHGCIVTCQQIQKMNLPNEKYNT